MKYREIGGGAAAGGGGCLGPPSTLDFVYCLVGCMGPPSTLNFAVACVAVAVAGVAAALAVVAALAAGVAFAAPGDRRARQRLQLVRLRAGGARRRHLVLSGPPGAVMRP